MSERIVELENEIEAMAQTYVPSQETAEFLPERSLGLIIGPFATGKSTLIDQAIRSDNRFGRAVSFTTRDPRPQENYDQYDFRPHTIEALEGIRRQAKAQELVQLAVHPQTWRVYGSTVATYQRPISLIDVMASAAEPMLRIPFKNHFIVGVVCEPEVHIARSQAVARHDADDIQKRTIEGVQSLDWLLDRQDEVFWINNTISAIPMIAHHMMGMMLGTYGCGQGAADVAVRLREHLYQESYK